MTARTHNKLTFSWRAQGKYYYTAHRSNIGGRPASYETVPISFSHCKHIYLVGPYITTSKMLTAEQDKPICKQHVVLLFTNEYDIDHKYF